MLVMFKRLSIWKCVTNSSWHKMAVSWMWAVSTVTVKTPSTTLLSNVFINMSTDTHTHISCGRTLVLLCLQVKPQLRCSLLFYFSNNINGNNSVLHKTIFLCHLTSSLCGVYCTEVFMPLSCMCTLIHRGAFQSFFSNSTATTFSKLCGSAARTRSTHTHTHCTVWHLKQSLPTNRLIWWDADIPPRTNPSRGGLYRDYSETRSRTSTARHSQHRPSSERKVSRLLTCLLVSVLLPWCLPVCASCCYSCS